MLLLCNVRRGLSGSCRSLQLQRTNCRFVLPHAPAPRDSLRQVPSRLVVSSPTLYGSSQLAALTCTIFRGSADFSSTGNTYSIRNVGSGTARVFFAQARETAAGE
jgi:hypothetical protein